MCMKVQLSEQKLTGTGIEGMQGVSRAKSKPARKDGCKMVSRLNTMREEGREKKREREQCRG